MLFILGDEFSSVHAVLTHWFLLTDSILNSQQLDDGDDNLDVAMPDDLNDQNLSELASSISAHDLNSMSQALTVSVLNSALDINTANANTVPNSASNNAAAFRSAVAAATAAAAAGVGVAQGPRMQQVNGLPGVSDVQQQQQLPAGMRPGQPLTFPILQGQLLQGQLVTAATGGPLVQGPALTPVTAQRAPQNPPTTGQQRLSLQEPPTVGQRPHPQGPPTTSQRPSPQGPSATGQRQPPQGPPTTAQRPLLQGPPNAIVQGSMVHTVRGGNASRKQQQQGSSAASRGSKQTVPAPVVSTPAPNPRAPSSGGIVQNLLQSPPIVAPPPVHQHRPNNLQSSRMNHAQSFQIQGHSIQAQEMPRPSPRGGQGQQQGQGQCEGQLGPRQNSLPQQQQQKHQQQQEKDQISVIRAQLPQGPPTLPQNQLQIQMPSALAALGGTAFTVSPQNALMAAASVGGKAQSQLAGQLFSSPPSSGGQQPGAVPNLVPPHALVPGQINGNMLNATEQLKQLVSPVAMTPNNKKRSRSKRSNKHVTNTPQNHVATTANQSQQTTTTTLPLLTANQFRADGTLPATGLKLALPLAMLPGRHDVSAVLTSVNGTTQEPAKPAAHAQVAPKRSRSSSASAKKQKTQTNPQNPVSTS